MPRPTIIRRLAIAAAGIAMLAGAVLGTADGPAVPAGSSVRTSSATDAASADPTTRDVPPAKPWRITEGLRDLRPATPMSPAETGPYEVTRYAIDNGAIALTFDPEADVLSVLFPMGGDPPPAPATGLNVSVRTAAFPNAALDAAASDLTSLDWSSEARSYGYGISLDAATGLIVVETDAPAEVTDIVAARHPGIFRFERGSPMRSGSLPGAGPRA